MAGPLAYVFTTERTFQIVPSADPSRVIEPQEVLGAGGLWSQWGVAVGDAIYKIEVDGIYFTTGGAHTSLTSPLLTQLFPHDGINGVQVTLGSQVFYPPDFSQASALRLSWENGHLLFNYIDTTSVRRQIVYSTIFGVWSVDTYSFGSVYSYMEEGQGINSVLVCGADGNLYQVSGSVAQGASEVRMPYIGTFDGFVHVREGYLGLVSSGASTLTVNADGTDYPVSISGVANYQKIYTALPAVKGRTFEFAFGGTAFELYLEDSVVHLKPWGAPGGYEPYRMFALGGA
jgi:hypothetical protein